MLKLLTSSSQILCEKGLSDLQKLTAAVPAVIARRQHSHTGNGPSATPVGSPGSQPKIDFTARLLEMRNGQKVTSTTAYQNSLK
ncbi:Hypp7376 [Branchiostoma lanceolatum]|uniref:Hypp7376 protein n=1 Tax=Branchiostoma lanceolatum TaxID=7740 RepID=A0A8J9Z050_BRALA|nr:Hypp7376 [Branchiostoma lanceolatum]